MKDFNELTLEEIAEIVTKQKMRYELRIEPNGYGNSNITVEVEPWEPFEPKCPYGTPIVYVKGKKLEERD